MRGRSWAWLVVAAVGCGGESPGADGGLTCAVDRECADELFCNGAERCAPADPDADARGCAPASAPPPCLDGQVCDELAHACVTDCERGGDADGDGAIALECGGDDCADGDPSRFPESPEVCDADDVDEDCDPRTYGSRDRDGDMFDDGSCCNVAPDGFTRVCGVDCGDTTPSIFPGAQEVCDGADQDCDGVVDGDFASLRCPLPDGTTAMECVAGACEVLRCGEDRDDCDGDPSNGCEALLLADVDHCGACGAACPDVANGEARCDAGRCTASRCEAGFHVCGDVCAANDSALTCGANCSPCVPPPNATATCDGAECGYTCNEATVATRDGCELVAPRSIAPLSTARATSPRPTFEVELPVGADGFEVEVCTDRTCAEVTRRFVIAGTRGRPDASLPSGAIYWRAASASGGVPSLLHGAVWKLHVSSREREADTSGGTIFDADLDGTLEAALGTPDRDASPSVPDAGGVQLYRADSRSLVEGGAIEGRYFEDRLGEHVRPVGDVDGDGYPDLAVGAPGSGETRIYPGGAGGLALVERAVVAAVGRLAALGDVDRDGYADFAIATGTELLIVYGGPLDQLGVRTTTLTAPADRPTLEPGSIAAGDVDGDGFADVVVTWSLVESVSVEITMRSPVGTFSDTDTVERVSSRTQLHRGGAGGLDATIADALEVGPYNAGHGRWTFVGFSLDASLPYHVSAAGVGDLNGDGYGDVVVGRPTIDLPAEVTVDVGFSDPLGDIAEAVIELLTEAEAVVFLGASAPALVEATVIPGIGLGFAHHLSATGDLDGDGLDDLVVPAGVATLNDPRPQSLVYLGNVDAEIGAPLGTIFGTARAGTLGVIPAVVHTHHGVGDLDGDGADELIVLHGGNPDFGARLYAGNAGLTETRSLAPFTPQSTEQRGAIAGTPGQIVTSDGASVALFSPSTTGLAGPAPGASPDAASNLGHSLAAGIVPDDGSPVTLWAAGAPLDSSAAASAGRVELYQGSTRIGTAYGTVAGERYGELTTFAGSHLVVGRDGGAVDVYGPTSSGLGPVLQSIAGTFHEARAAGDPNDDELADLILYDALAEESHLHLGVAGGFAASSALVVSGRAFAAGDFDGDGIDDLAVQTSSGLDVHFGGAAGPTALPSLAIVAPVEAMAFGAAVASPGDLDGDGRSELLVGAPESRDPLRRPAAGLVYLVRGASDAASVRVSVVTGGDRPNHRIGQTLACGDFNGDGIGDCAVFDGGAVADLHLRELLGGPTFSQSLSGGLRASRFGASTL